MSTVSAIFSALGNNSSIAQIAVKDGLETVGRTAMAYKEGSKTSKKFGALEARERHIEANDTSLVWLGGIPTLNLKKKKITQVSLTAYISPSNPGLQEGDRG